MQKQNFQLLAQYNRWMNEKILSACENLSAEELVTDRGAFFGSILGTLNHLMVGDILWLKRFAEGTQKFGNLDQVSAMAGPASLDAHLYTDLKSFAQARRALDADIIGFCDEITQQQLGEKLAYKTIQGTPFEDELGLLVQHLFNHQTHHRGQITTLLSQASIDVGPTDLLVCQRELYS